MEPPPLLRQITPVSSNLFQTETRKNPSIVSMVNIWNGYIDHKKLINHFNKIFLPFYRLKSTVVMNGKYWKEIPNFKFDERMIKLNIPNKDFIHKNDETVRQLMKYANDTMYNKIYDELINNNQLPKYRFELFHFNNNISALIWYFHHGIGDGLAIYQYYNLIGGLPHNLTNDTQLKNYSILQKLGTYKKKKFTTKS
eukprot:38179_1